MVGQFNADAATSALQDRLIAADAELATLRAERDKAVGERDAAVAALKLTQWGFNHRRCPVCAGFDPKGNGETDYRHTATCPVDAALAHTGAG